MSFSGCANSVSDKDAKMASESLGKVADTMRPFMSKEDQAKLDKGIIRNQESLLRYAMNHLESAVVQYASEHGGEPPALIDDRMHGYLVKEMNKNSLLPTQYIRGKGIVNPFTNQAEWPSIGTISDVTAVRKADPKPMRPGEIQYNSIHGKSFAIIGGGANGKALSEPLLKQDFKTYVLSDIFEQ